MLEDFSGAQTFAGTPEQMKAWNAARRARIASKRRADTRLSLLSQASGVRSVNNADQARAVTMNGRDGQMIPEWTDLDQEGFEAYRELHDANAELKRLNRQLRILRIKLVVAYMEYLLVMVTTAMFSIMVFASVAK